MLKTRTLGAFAAAMLTIAAFGSAPASAGGTCSELQLQCENGHTYPLCPIAVSDIGEVVTGHLVTAPRRGIHVRLVPMGQGYRYIGRGVWFDGVREDGLLYFGNNHPIACKVYHG
jgi:hypothetical protein